MSKKSLLRGIIFKEENPSEKQKASNEVKSSPVVNTANVSIQGVADNKFITMLEEVIEKNNLPGQDYFEFKQAIEHMKSLAMDEKSKFQTAYTVLSLQGCKKDILLSSIEKYISIIQEQKKEFDAEMQLELNSKVKSKLDEVEKSKKEMENLSKRLNDLNSSILCLSQDAQTEEMKIRATEANFKASADIIISEMISDKGKIETFITV